MSNRTISVTDRLYEYLLSVSLREDPWLAKLREETRALADFNMQIAPEQGQFMALLVRLMGARRALEIGTFTGYSSICVARELAKDGRLICCDISEEWTAIAQRYWQATGLDDRIELKLAPALETLDRMIAEGQAGSIDFVFIDADKQGYVDYYERSLVLLRSGGVIAVDNTLWDGAVADQDNNEPGTRAIRDFNRHVASDTRIQISLVPIGDGLTLCRKQ